MKRKKRILTLLFLVFSQLAILQAQYFGGFYNNIKWLQVETPHVRVVFPAGLSDKANRVASNIEYLIAKQQNSLDFSLRKITIVLNNQGVESNGYVSTVPYHSMYYLTDAQDANMIGTQNWLDGLSIHEYRHVWQYNQMRSGLCKVFQVLMGDRGWDAYNLLIFPDWYFEGDAVFSETKYSISGRGRVPNFSLTQRAMALDSVNYKYMKVRNGSYKRELPNYYEYGYNLLAYGTKKFGEEGWQRVVKKASRLSGVLYPFSHAIRKETGHGMRTFYDSMRVDFNKYTVQKNAFRNITPTTKITKACPKTVTNYYQSVYETDSTVLVLKNSYKELLAFYRVNIITGEEKKLHTVGYLDNPRFSYAQGKLLWSEFRHHKRRWNKGYSIIKEFELGSIFSDELTQETNYFSPAFSPDAQKIAVVEYTPNQQCSIHLLNASKGYKNDSVIPALCFGDSLFASTPTFSDDGKSLVFILKKTDKLALFEYYFLQDSLIQLTDYTSNTITNPVVKNGKVYFSSSIGGQDDIFCLNKSDKTIARVTDSRVGAYYPSLSPNGKQLLFSNYTLQGFDLQLLNLNETLPLISTVVEPVNEDYYASQIFSTPHNLTDSVVTTPYELTKYNRKAHMLNLHSWGPTVAGFNTGVEIYSDNILNNTSVLAGMYYNYYNQLPYARASVYYGGLNPVIYFQYTHLFANEANQQIIEPGILFPFDSSTPRKAKSLTLQAGLLFQNLTIYNEGYYPLSGLHLSLQREVYRLPAKQQVDKRLGFGLAVDIKEGILQDTVALIELSVKSNVYVPGFAKTHAAKIQLAGKVQTSDGFFMDEMEYSRGYYRPDSMYMAYAKAGLNYQLPLCYPEFGINGVFYLKRIRLNIFGDFGAAAIYHFDDTIRPDYSPSVGAELYFDINWFNAIEIPLFVRYSYCFNQSNKTIPLEFGTPLVSF
ncbi:MAG: PD40 domain-containing protein [Paludibacteraceae bacterium]|nr:PD40 domain-containing protein [Paludibacteraceae bacterium]MBN2787900.1 PD40 domain-containing protein [Paludibacteraceae bacterium]